MAKDRLKLHTELCTLLGSTNVYFQPPATVKMNYPCIIYNRDSRLDINADNRKYLGMKGYLVTVVDKNPDSEIPDKMLKFRYCSFIDHIVVDNLNHDMYLLYY